MQENDFTLLLTDEEGNEFEYELLDRIEYKGNTYAALLPAEDDSSEPEVLILLENESGELVGFDDVAVLDAVFDIFRKNNGF